MPIKVKTNLEWGQSFYLKSDPDQLEHLLVAVIIVPASELPGNNLKFRLSYMGEVVEVYDFECTTEKDESKIVDSD